MKTVFLFSGQGSQYAGMGKELYENFRVVKDIFDEADGILGFSLSKMCFEADERLNLTEYTQAAILTMSVAICELLKEKGIEADYHIGLSLGEYSALSQAGAISFQDVLPLIKKRGEIMSQAVNSSTSGMYALMGANIKIAQDACAEASKLGIVSVTNYNSADQIVIGGENEALEQAVKIAEKIGIKRAIKLNVSGAFHTALLKEASQKLKAELEKVTFTELQKSVLSNVSGDFYNDSSEITKTLTKQIMCPVRFYDCVKTVSAQNADCYIEVGPGRALSGFVKKILSETDKTSDVNILNIEDIKSLDKTLSKLKVGGI